MSVIDTLLKTIVIIGVALASGAVVYHYTIYIPNRDVEADAARRLEAATTAENERVRKEAEARKAAADKLAEERKSVEDKFAEEQRKLEIAARYEACLRSAQVNYSGNWDSNCKRIENIKRKNHDDCVRDNLSNQYKLNCDTLYPLAPKGESCALPTVLANSLDKTLEQSKTRCFQEMQIGLQ